MTDALVPPAKTPVEVDAFSHAVAGAQAEIASAIDRAGLRNDPYRFLMGGLSTAIGVFPDFLRQMREAAQEARQPLDEAGLARLEAAAATGAERRAGGLARAYNLRTMALISTMMATSIVSACAGSYWWGRSDALARFQVVEEGFAQLVHDDPSNATGWLNLIRQNDYGQIMASCRGDRAFTDPSGRRACMAALWIEPPKIDAVPKPAAR